ncbi:hypothetical protein CPZ30_12665 [Paenibacillus lautus]|nr:hypothetical protein CPZ30_12665 [Paenibacillus lautus]
MRITQHSGEQKHRTYIPEKKNAQTAERSETEECKPYAQAGLLARKRTDNVKKPADLSLQIAGFFHAANMPKG